MAKVEVVGEGVQAQCPGCGWHGDLVGRAMLAEAEAAGHQCGVAA